MSASDAVAGRLPWRDLSDLVRVLLADPSSRLCAAVRGWAAPVDARWLLVALMGAWGVEPRWPWLDESEPVPEADLERARRIAMEGWA